MSRSVVFKSSPISCLNKITFRGITFTSSTIGCLNRVTFRGIVFTSSTIGCLNRVTFRCFVFTSSTISCLKKFTIGSVCCLKKFIFLRLSLWPNVVNNRDREIRNILFSVLVIKSCRKLIWKSYRTHLMMTACEMKS